MKEEILEQYASGKPLGIIIANHNITHSHLIKILLDHKEDHRKGRTFTDEFKQMIADRDLNGIPRRQIGQELELNASTIKSACEKFGQVNKEKANSDSAYEKLPDVENLDSCPTCGNKHVNHIDSMYYQINTDGIYCKKCGDEHFYLDVYEEVTEKNDKGKKVKVNKLVRKDVYKINFEYLES